MCGITGIYSFNLVGKFNKIHVTAATEAISRRGPDHQNIHIDESVALGHRRLSIIDTSDIAHQPMWDESRRYCIIFNGEIFNYLELKTELKNKGVTFFSSSDTEVLLKLLIREKEAALNRLNGFFSFCFYDTQEQTLFLARDRYGIKPLLYLFDEDKFIFSSEMKSLLCYGIERQIDTTSLLAYLQLNYIPAPHTIFKNVNKLMPGHWLKVSKKALQTGTYYQIPYGEEHRTDLPYDAAKEKFKSLLETSVQRRLVSDVPLGSFLSGGVDSSVISALAARHKPDLHTFSIGFRDEPFFDETNYARLVAKKLGTEHTVFSLTNDDLYAQVNSILDYIDEPFADSSAIAVNILSKETRKHATVALSGDGADELLAGYNKHAASYRTLHPGIKENIASSLLPLWKSLPQSRNSKWSNTIRQLQRFAEGRKMNSRDRYWKWATFASENEALQLLRREHQSAAKENFPSRQGDWLSTITKEDDINDVLLTDVRLVLPNDMLTKVDLMSMAHGLEVRVPFLDFELVNFIFSLPEDFKITGDIRKRILQDSFRDILPVELYNRPKKGFEVPLLKWFRREMKSLIVDDLLSERFIIEQGIFELPQIELLKKKLFSSNPGDVHARIWGLIVFQWWWKKYFK